MVVAYSLESGKGYGPMIFARLLIGIPLAFLVGFAARQYSRERRAEEEYAFKSLISVSLEPYRNLIEKMNSGSPEDKEFLKDLIRNIFDNPAKRLYPSLSPDGETPTTDGTPLRTSRSPSTPPPASPPIPVPPTA
jgi:hypothetical protein